MPLILVSPLHGHWHQRTLRFGTLWMGCEIAILELRGVRTVFLHFYVASLEAPRPNIRSHRLSHLKRIQLESPPVLFL